MAKAKSFNILGTDISALTLEQGVKQAATKLADTKKAHYIALPHVEFIMRAHRDAKVQSALSAADLCLPNGVALTWAANYLYGGQPGTGRWAKTLMQIVTRPQALQTVLPERFTSDNFTRPLLKQAAGVGLSVFLIGSPKRQTIDAVGAYLAGAIPKLVIAGTFTGQLTGAKEAELVAKLNAAKPALILIGMGFPKQELLMQRLQPQLQSGLMIGEGGSFDYQDFGGHIKRAPKWLRQHGLEWLWRLLREPSRLGRQLVIPWFIWLIYLEGRKPPRN